MSAYASLFKAFLDRKGIRYKEGNMGAISIIYNTDNAKSVEVFVAFDDDGKNRVTLISFTIGEFPQSQFAKALVTCNAMNRKYRWVKFYVNDDNCITVSSDAILDEDTCGDECFEYVYRMIRIVDEVYPEFMKARWA